MTEDAIEFYLVGDLKRRKALWAALYGIEVRDFKSMLFPSTVLSQNYKKRILQSLRDFRICEGDGRPQTVSTYYIEESFDMDDIVVVSVKKERGYGKVITGFATLAFHPNHDETHMYVKSWNATLSVICSISSTKPMIDAILRYLRELVTLRDMPIEQVKLQSLHHARTYYKRFGFLENARYAHQNSNEDPIESRGSGGVGNRRRLPPQREPMPMINMQLPLLTANQKNILRTAGGHLQFVRNWHPQQTASRASSRKRNSPERSQSTSNSNQFTNPNVRSTASSKRRRF